MFQQKAFCMGIRCWPARIPNNFAWVSKPNRDVGSHPQWGFPKPTRMPLNPATGEKWLFRYSHFPIPHFPPNLIYNISVHWLSNPSKLIVDSRGNAIDLGMLRRETDKQKQLWDIRETCSRDAGKTAQIYLNKGILYQKKWRVDREEWGTWMDLDRVGRE